MNETMIRGWESKELGLIAEFIRNGFNADQEDEGLYPVSRIETISNGVVDFSRVKYTSTMSDENIQKYMLNYNDILFSHINSPSHVGKTAIYKENKPLLHGANLLAIRVKKTYSADYVNAYLKQLKQQNYFLVRCNKAVNQASIKQSEIAKIPIPFPPLPQQEKIVSVLDTASALVEKQKALLEKYDLFLKSKFIEMFGDPVKNPMGWEVKGFLDILNLTTGKLDSNASEEDGIYPFFTCAQETFAINTYAFDCEALLLAGNNAAGVYSIKHYNGKFNAYQRTYVLTLKDTKNKYEFFKMLLETKLLELQNVSIGTNTKYLTLGILKNINMYIPEQKLQVEFSKIVKQTEILKQKEQQKLEKLQTLYGALMSRAFQGEIE